MLCRTLPTSSLPLVALPALMLLGCGSAGDRDDASQSAVALGSPTAAFADDFGAITTVRELPHGRVMVADPLVGRGP